MGQQRPSAFTRLVTAQDCNTQGRSYRSDIRRIIGQPVRILRTKSLWSSGGVWRYKSRSTLPRNFNVDLHTKIFYIVYMKAISQQVLKGTIQPNAQIMLYIARVQQPRWTMSYRERLIQNLKQHRQNMHQLSLWPSRWQQRLAPSKTHHITKT